MGKLTVTTLAPDMKRTHDNSVASSTQDLTRRGPVAEPKPPKISTTSLREKGLLVPARLALKRQRAVLKPPTMKIEPDNHDAYQVELGRMDELESPQRPNTFRGGTPHTAATDISVVYREKPLTSHPVTGQYVSQYIEDGGSPSPCSYFPPRKPCRERNAPAYTFGARCLVEKDGGSRTGWQKQWFAHSDPYTTKVDFGRETIWPSPLHYAAKPALGNQTSKVTFPAYSLAARLHTNPILLAENNPSPDTYNTVAAFHKLTGTNTFTTLKSRTGGTQLTAVPIKGRIPGPGAHDQAKFLSNKHSAPKHSFGLRLPTSLRQDPYVNTLPPVETR